MHVLRGDGLAGAPVGALAGLRRLADDVGATFHTVVGDDVPDRAARLRPRRQRHPAGARHLAAVPAGPRFDEGIGARVVQDSGPIDVHMVTHDEAGRGLRLPRLASAVPLRRQALGWVLAVAAAAARHRRRRRCGRELIGLSTDVVLFFLATVVVALVGGLGPALLAAFGGGAAAELLPHPAALHASPSPSART